VYIKQNLLRYLLNHSVVGMCL